MAWFSKLVSSKIVPDKQCVCIYVHARKASAQARAHVDTHCFVHLKDIILNGLAAAD